MSSIYVDCMCCLRRNSLALKVLGRSHFSSHTAKFLACIIPVQLCELFQLVDVLDILQILAKIAW